jgi:hypothetical protein
MIHALSVSLELRWIEVHVPEIARAVSLSLVVALARTLSPNSTTATKLLPLLPYHFFVPGYARAAKDASDPHLDDVNGTGMLGAASSNFGKMSSVIR